MEVFSRLIGASQRPINKACLTGEGFIDSRSWRIFDDHLNQPWKDLKELTISNFATSGILASPLLDSAEKILSLKIANTRSTSDRAHDMLCEHDLLIKRLADVKIAKGKTDLHEFMYQQMLGPAHMSTRGVSSAILQEFLTKVTSIRTLCVHQWSTMDEGPESFASLQAQTLHFFSWRDSQEDIPLDHLSDLAKSCPRLRALGFNYSSIRKGLDRPSSLHHEHFTETFAKTSDELFGALQNLQELHTLCIFT